MSYIQRSEAGFSTATSSVPPSADTRGELYKPFDPANGMTAPSRVTDTSFPWRPADSPLTYAATPACETLELRSAVGRLKDVLEDRRRRARHAKAARIERHGEDAAIMGVHQVTGWEIVRVRATLYRASIARPF